MKIWKWVRWIICGPAGFVFGIALMELFFFTSDHFLERYISYYYLVALGYVGLILTFILMVIVSCLIAPKPKIYAAVISSALSVWFIAGSLYVSLFERMPFSGPIRIPEILNYVAMFVGLLIGVCHLLLFLPGEGLEWITKNQGKA
jgi:hypothetical protein